MSTDLEKLMGQWLARRGAEPEPPDDDGWHHLVFDGEHEIAVAQFGTRIVFEADVAAVPSRQADAEAQASALMKLALARAHQSSEILSIDPVRETITLHTTIETRGLPLAAFETVLGSFVNAVEFWEAQSKAAQPPASRDFYGSQPQFLFP